jgi:preprotein translocase subunit SecF
MRYIFSSIVIEGVTLEQVSQKSSVNFLENFKKNLIEEVHKYHAGGLESIKITSLNTYKNKNLVIEFVAVVNPSHHQQISDAISRALVSTKVSLLYLQIFFIIIYCAFRLRTH